MVLRCFHLFHFQLSQAKILPELTEDDLNIMRKAWYKYTKNLTKVAAGVHYWMEHLRTMTCPSGEHSLHAGAGATLDFCLVAQRIAAAVQEEYTATIVFWGDQANATTNIQKAFINYTALPYMPDVVAIVYHILKQSQMQKGVVQV